MATADSSCMQVMNSGLLLPPYVTIDSWMPRQEEAGLLNTKSILSDLSTSTMKSEPGRPGRVPGGTCTRWVANSACASTVDGRVAAGLAASAVAAFPFPATDTAVAAPVIATPARNLRRLTSVGAFLRATTFPRMLFRHFRWGYHDRQHPNSETALESNFFRTPTRRNSRGSESPWAFLPIASACWP